MPARKKTTATKSRATKRVTKKVIASSTPQATRSKFFDFFKSGESYTSLVLGVIAVIIVTIVVLSTIHNRQAKNLTPEVTPTIADSQSIALKPTGGMSPAAAPGESYTVVAGDNLWTIAEKAYKSGYNWVDIAKANKLAHPGDIHVGNKLVLPKVTPMVATVRTNDEHLSRTKAEKITTTTYTIKPGDDLWGIAVRKYGDGHQWVKIAKANNLTNPSLIHVDNTLKLP